MPFESRPAFLTCTATGRVAGFRRAAIGATLIVALTSCGVLSSDRLDPTPHESVDLSGEWVLNINLSDDPSRAEDQPATQDGGKQRHGHDISGPGGAGGFGVPGIGGPGGRGGTMGPPDTDPDSSNNPNSLRDTEDGPGSARVEGLDIAATPHVRGGADVRYDADQDTSSGPGTDQAPPGIPVPASEAPGSGTKDPKALVVQLFAMPNHFTITQHGPTVSLKVGSPTGQGEATDYVSGEHKTLTLAHGTATRTSGWQGEIFIVITKVRKGATREDDYALDDEGHLILTTFVSGKRVKKTEIKRVYDHVKPKS